MEHKTDFNVVIIIAIIEIKIIIIIKIIPGKIFLNVETILESTNIIIENIAVPNMSKPPIVGVPCFFK